MRLLCAAALSLAVLPGLAPAQDPAKPLRSLRGPAPITDLNPSQAYRMERHDRLIARNYEQQPPVIPHNVKGYQITRNVNMCMVCHARAAAPTSGATAVGKSHYLDREGRILVNLSTRRYFCLQCHVPQHDAEPLVRNDFRPSGAP